MAFEWSPLKKSTLCMWLIAWCMMSPPYAALLSHSLLFATSVMLTAWPCHDRRVFEERQGAVCLFWLFWFLTLENECGPLNNWDGQCLPPKYNKKLCNGVFKCYFKCYQFVKRFVSLMCRFCFFVSESWIFSLKNVFEWENKISQKKTVK